MAAAGTLELVHSAPRDAAFHEHVCRVCGDTFATVGGDNWREPARTTCGPCLTDPEPAPPGKT